jgi:FlaA1/EpsC-like NDP-sugar epimerase
MPAERGPRSYMRKRLHWRRVRASVFDIVVVLSVYYLLFDFRSALATGPPGHWHPWTAEFGLFVSAAVAVHLGLNLVLGNYSVLNKFIGLPEAIRFVQAGAASTCVLLIVVISWQGLTHDDTYLIPRSVALGGVLVLVLMVAARFSRRAVYEMTRRGNAPKQRVLLIGAGEAAHILAKELQRNPSTDLKVVGLLDDDSALARMSVYGLRVLGTVDQVARVAEEQRISEIIIAIPSATAQQLSRIHGLCKPTGLPIKTLPSLSELVSKQRISVGDARDLRMVDLLGRPAVTTDRLGISEYVHGRTVLVTGAGGSIGSELCSQIAECWPRNMVLVDHDESALYELHERLKTVGFSRYDVQPWSILDRSKMKSLFSAYRPDLVFHAAAYKHVPLMELAPDQAVLNNVRGTLVISELAGEHGSERFVYISTDKAVEPVSVMGATKRAGELIIRKMSRTFPETSFASVRFGNVLGSQGSVIPIFKRQIENGGPVVITHPGMRRYFMLIEEAVQLVLQAALLCEENVVNGLRNLNTFVLEMGNPVSIVEVAQKMLDFYWREPKRSIGVEFCGLRPGEKLDETLTWPQERTSDTCHPLIKRVCSVIEDRTFEQDIDSFEERLPRLINFAATHPEHDEVVQALARCVPGFTPMNGNGRPRSNIIVHERLARYPGSPVLDGVMSPSA